MSTPDVPRKSWGVPILIAELTMATIVLGSCVGVLVGRHHGIEGHGTGPNPPNSAAYTSYSTAARAAMLPVLDENLVVGTSGLLCSGSISESILSASTSVTPAQAELIITAYCPDQKGRP